MLRVDDFKCQQQVKSFTLPPLKSHRVMSVDCIQPGLELQTARSEQSKDPKFGGSEPDTANVLHVMLKFPIIITSSGR